ncbi:Ras family protein (macronuclear) [Tetrahymena thermophila SB210]|uniref:Ras family protein n=1 Tax=Tetrahymena thermophila (strain SB210) TaxID=312017 RepID=I7MHH3_TETTS|nr:Ras family protein [Tetrahymena thermophila SB210]EAS02974.2 Ras family protein [Tetrahymena thermophila SB210]|eukprot:XP_001023219.2 Ras family protein [Tetrahymena thermophila SB210]
MITVASNNKLNKVAIIGQEGKIIFASNRVKYIYYQQKIGSGKTSLLQKYSKPDIDISSQEKKITRIADQSFISQTLKDIKNKPLQISCFDTVGKESQKSLSRHLYRNALAIIIVFDLRYFYKNEVECLNQVKKWYKFSYAPDNNHQITPLTYFVGAKQDLLSEDQLNDFEYRRNKLFEKMNTIEKQYYIETSAYNNINIQKLFDDIFKGVFLEFIATTVTYEQFQNLNVFTLNKVSNQMTESSINSKNQSKNYASLYSESENNLSERNKNQSQNSSNIQANNQKELNIGQSRNQDQNNGQSNQDDLENQKQINLQNQSEKYNTKSQNPNTIYVQNNNQKEKNNEKSSCC